MKNCSLAGIILAAVACGCAGGATGPQLPAALGTSFEASRTLSASAPDTAPTSKAEQKGVPAGYVFMPHGTWARPIPSHPPVAPQSQTWLNHMFNAGYGMSLLQFEESIAGAHGDGNTPVYYATNRDPLYTIHCTQFDHCPEEGERVRIPRGARPADGGDHHMAVVNFGDNREDDFWLAAKPNGTGGKLDIGFGGHGPLDGDGTNFKATASGVALTAGMLRATDLMAGFIPHALYVTASCTSSAHAYPAVSSDDKNPNCPPQGTRLYLDLSAHEIGELELPHWAKTYLTAWHTYGAIISDHGGNNFALMLEHDYTYSLFGGPSPWLDFAHFVRNDPASKDVWAEPYDSVYHIVFPTSNIDLRSHLKILMPCVNSGTC